MRGPRRVVINDGHIPYDRYEIRPPKIEYMSPQPEYEYRSMALMPSITAPLVDESSMYYNTSFEQIVFSYTEIIYVRWVESNVENGTSFGYFIEFVSYVYLPDGLELERLISNNQEVTYGGNNLEQQYRRGMIDIHGQLDTLRRDRVILPQEEIDKIHSGVKTLDEKPIQSEWFEDENIFEME